MKCLTSRPKLYVNGWVRRLWIKLYIYSALHFISKLGVGLLKLIAQLVKMRCKYFEFSYILYQLNNGIFINVKSRYNYHKIMRIMVGWEFVVRVIMLCEYYTSYIKELQ